MMKMHNPLHPGEFITDIFLEPLGISGRELALKLDVAPSTLSRILKGSSRVSPEMALRLSKAIGRSPESWLTIQQQLRNEWQSTLKTPKRLMQSVLHAKHRVSPIHPQATSVGQLNGGSSLASEVEFYS